jgi:hypothetical protein
VAHFHTLDDRKYGFETSVIGPFRKGGADHLDDHLEGGPFDIENYFPTVHTHEEKLLAAGFRDNGWPQPMLSPEGDSAHGRDYWTAPCFPIRFSIEPPTSAITPYAQSPRRDLSMRRDTTSRSKFPRLGFQLILPVVAVAWLAASSNCRATPISYVFSDASTDLNGVTETINGQFTFNTTFNTQSSVIITLSGPDPYAGTYSISSAASQFDNNSIIAPYEINSSVVLAIVFSDPLNVSPDPLESVTIDRAGIITDDSPLGKAIFATTTTTTTPVPEPSALALLGTALAGLFLFRSWANWRDRYIHPPQHGGLCQSLHDLVGMDGPKRSASEPNT